MKAVLAVVAVTAGLVLVAILLIGGKDYSSELQEAMPGAARVDCEELEDAGEVPPPGAAVGDFHCDVYGSGASLVSSVWLLRPDEEHDCWSARELVPSERGAAKRTPEKATTCRRLSRSVPG